MQGLLGGCSSGDVRARGDGGPLKLANTVGSSSVQLNRCGGRGSSRFPRDCLHGAGVPVHESPR